MYGIPRVFEDGFNMKRLSGLLSRHTKWGVHDIEVMGNFFTEIEEFDMEITVGTQKVVLKGTRIVKRGPSFLQMHFVRVVTSTGQILVFPYRDSFVPFGKMLHKAKNAGGYEDFTPESLIIKLQSVAMGVGLNKEVWNVCRLLVSLIKANRGFSKQQWEKRVSEYLDRNPELLRHEVRRNIFEDERMDPGWFLQFPTWEFVERLYWPTEAKRMIEERKMRSWGVT